MIAGVSMRLLERVAASALVCSSALFICSHPPLAALAAPYMDCEGAPLCGVLTLETGLGNGPYAHDSPSVHGLWPEVNKYGSSQCIRCVHLLTLLCRYRILNCCTRS